MRITDFGAFCKGVGKSYSQSGKQRATLLAELFDFFAQRVLGNIEIFRKTGYAHKALRAAVYQLFVKSDFVARKLASAAYTDIFTLRHERDFPSVFCSCAGVRLF